MMIIIIIKGLGDNVINRMKLSEGIPGLDPMVGRREGSCNHGFTWR